MSFLLNTNFTFLHELKNDKIVKSTTFLLSETHGTGQLADSTAAKSNDRWWEALLAATETTFHLGAEHFQQAKIKYEPLVRDLSLSDETMS